MSRIFYLSLGLLALFASCADEYEYLCDIEIEQAFRIRLDSLEERKDSIELFRLVDSLKSVGDNNLSGEVLYYIGRVYGDSRDPERRYEIYARARDQFAQGEPFIFQRYGKMSVNALNDFFGKVEKADSLVLGARQALTRLQPYRGCNELDGLRVELYHAMGNGLRNLGDYEGAEFYLTKGAEYCTGIDSNTYWQCSRLIREIARVQVEVEELDKARETMQRADYFFSEIRNGDDAFIADNFETKIEIALEADQTNSLRSLVDSVFRYCDLSDDGSDHDKGDYYNNLGLALIENGQLTEARSALDTAVSYYTLAGADIDKGTCYENYAEIYLKEGDTLRALRYLDSAELAYHGDPGQPAIPGAIDRRELSDPLMTRALLTLQLHRSRPTTFPLAEVGRRVARVDSIFTLLQYGVGSERSKRLNIKRLRNFYEKVVAFGYDNWQKTKQSAYLDFAQTYLERSKGRILRERRRNTFAGIDKDGGRANDAIFAARSRLASLQKQLREAPPSKRPGVRSELQEAKQLVKTQVELGKGLAPIEFQPAATTAKVFIIANTLPRDHLVLDYLLGDSSLFISYATPAEQGMVRLPAADLPLRISQLLRSLEVRGRSRDWSNKDTPKKELANYAESATALYEMLLAPVLNEVPTTTHVTIIPDGVIGFVPFGALLTAEPAERTEATLASWPYAIRDYTFNYEFSADLWSVRSQDAYTGGQRTLVVSPEQEGNRTITPLGFDQPQLLAALSTEEGEELRESLNADLLAGPDAGKLREDRDFSDYGVLHFSGHGLAAPGNVYQSLLVLDARPDGQSTTLSLSDLEALPLNLQMLVLSACQTGLGEVAAEEGVISLGRAGAIAGARSVVTSLWYVNQSAKAQLFRQFYRELADKQARRDVAMRAAQLSLLDGGYKYTHPYYWAAFVHTGDSEALQPDFFTAR